MDGNNGAHQSGLGNERQVSDCGGYLGSDYKRYVSFYFTNFPAHLSNFYLRKGFEVCGMLEDVFVARKRNRFGEPYGFVKFSNVRNITKMTKALNDVWFGHFRVHAKLAKFERNLTREDESLQKEKVGFLKGTTDSLEKDVNQNPMRQFTLTSGEVRTKSTTTNTDSEKDGPGHLEGVHVGDVIIKLGARHEPAVQNEGQQQGVGISPKGLDMHATATQEKENRILLRSYPSKSDDVQWVHNGLVANVLNGEAIPVVQNRITDAALSSFLNLCFRARRGGKDAQLYHRGAWVRLYGVPLQAWNVNFFKLCVFDCGRFLRADNCSADRDRLDFSRVLIATPNLDIIKRVERVRVDGALVEIKILEEWGYAMGEDTCLFEEEIASEASQSDCEEGHVDPNVRRNVEMLIYNIAVGMEEVANEVVHGKSDVELPDKQFGNTSGVGESEGGKEKFVDILSPVGVQIEVQKEGPLRYAGDWDLRIGGSSTQTVTQDCPTTRKSNWESMRKNWVTMQGNDQMVIEDVMGIDKSIGVKFKGDNANMFNVLSREAKSKKDPSGHHQGEHRRRRVVMSEETKLQICDDFLCSTLWGITPHSFSYRPSAGASGGLLTIWDSSEVEVWSTESRDHVLWCHGWFTKSGEEFYVANVYAPCDDGAKQGLWGALSARIQSLGRQRTARLRGLSDHCSLVLSVNEEDWGPRPSRMLKCWRDVPGYKVFVRDKWNSFQVDGWGGYVLKKKLRMIKTALKDWHTAHAQNLPSRIECLKARLSTLERKGEEEIISEAEIDELHGVSSDIHSLSRMHASRRRRNAISMIQANGVTLEGVNPIWQAVFSHFASHFKAINMERPGPTTFGLKDFWVELRGDVMRFISEFHRNGKLTKGLNSTFIALIPKTYCPKRLNDFRPISLVSSLYKILAKVLANRLRLVIGSVISESQTAFVKGRQILDGILIANEVVDEARKSKKELMPFKVDCEKAYDSVDWGYLDDVMGRMSFPVLWRKWIKQCVCTTTASVLVNGSPTEEFPLERGLRQGDPLSPFLFLLAVEGLNVLMEAAVERKLFTGYGIGERDPVFVSHLQFVDDTLLLGVKSWANVRALRAILVLFETMSGLMVNFHKSMLVGVNISESWLGEAATALCCKVGKIPFLYLGLSIGGDPRRLGFWEPVLARLKNRLSGWKSRFLCFGGRLVLLKSVMTSRPVYAHSFFKAPSGVEVSIFAWRLLRDRLPTKLNLATRGILYPAAHFCVTGCGEAESAHHLFISCSNCGPIWTLVCSWIGATPVSTTSIRDHFVQFTGSTGGSRARRSL
ncbi:hypothetical protein TSUD_393660 [Trifolium subterraneum]|uniref:Reverse transcriptase domain-containing protein n=1 Tax=Trifolium subterraneum TaxID=3900 RepID=A0A2Z6NCJ9_TRISU|nr:hypothetical protein TSUD_393660 [Trifolium subterraneum]